MAEPQQSPLLIPFSRGVNTKSDPNTIPLPFLTTLENGIFQKSSTITKRNGFDELGTNTNTGDPVAKGAALTAFGNELLLFDDTSLYSRSQANSEWVSKGPATAVAVESTSVIRNGYQQTAADWAINGDLACYVWQDSRGGVRASAVDLLTGVFYQADVLLNSAGINPRVISCGNSLMVAYGDGVGNLRLGILSIADPTNFEPAKLLVTDASASGIFDWVQFGDAIVLAYANAAGTATMAYITPNGFLGVTPNGYHYPAVVGSNHPDLISLLTDGTKLYMLEYISGATFDCHLRNADLTQNTAPATIAAPDYVSNLTGYWDGASTVAFFYEVPGASGYVGTLSRTTSNVAVTDPTSFKAGMGLGAQPFLHESQSYVVLTYASATQSTYFVVKASTGTVVSRHLYGQAPGALAGPTLPKVLSPTAGAFAWPGLKKGKLNSQNGSVFTLTGVELQSVNFAAPGRYQAAALGPDLIIAGGIIQTYDSARLVEHGFLLAPEAIYAAAGPGGWTLPPGGVTSTLAVALTAATATPIYIQAGDWASFTPGGYIVVDPGEPTQEAWQFFSTSPPNEIVPNGLPTFAHNHALGAPVYYAPTGADIPEILPPAMSDGTYLYKVVWEWTDNKGQVHRSSPSAPISVTLSGGGATQSVDLSIPPLRITNKTGVIVGIYRTTNNGTVYFKTSSVIAPLENDPTQIELSFNDTTSDADLQNNEILYTVGGELPNDPPPAGTLIAAGKGRIFIGGAEDGDVIYYSKTQVNGTGVGFSLAFAKRINPTGGKPSALGLLDDKVIVFKPTSIYWFSGDGPNAAGGNDNFTAAQMLAADVGCTNPASLVLSSEGLYFSSNKGIYLLTRSLQIEYVGAPVEGYNGQTVTSAVMLQGVNQVRYGCSSGYCLVYNYFFNAPFDDQVRCGQWSTFTNYESVGACIWRGQYAFLRANGQVRVENSGFLDGADPIKLRLRTAWIKPEVLGFSRIFEAAVLGTFYSHHQLIVNVAYDFRPFDEQQAVFDTRTGIPLSEWGADEEFGDDSTWGGYGDNSYQFRNRLSTQQCTAVQFEFSDNVPSGVTPGQGFSLTALQLLVGLQPGLSRLPPIRTI